MFLSAGVEVCCSCLAVSGAVVTKLSLALLEAVKVYISFEICLLVLASQVQIFLVASSR